MLPENSDNSLSEQLKYLLRLVVYADMYDYALRIEDISAFWGIDKKTINNAVKREFLETKEGYIYLVGRAGVLAKTKKARAIAIEKAQEAKYALEFFFKVPWVKFVGLSGSIGALNAKEADDYDAFIITQRHTKWIVRALEIYFALIKKNRASKNAPHQRNTICANVYVEQGRMTLPIEKRNLFVAYQCLLIFSLHGEKIYKHFLAANPWICGYFPGLKLPSKSRKKYPTNYFYMALNFLFSIPQKLKIISGGGKLKDVEVGGNLFFHPEDPSHTIVKRFNAKYLRYLKAFGLA